MPESFKVIRQVRPKFSCGRCETVVEAAAPSRPIPRSYAGPGLLAHVLVAKYCDHTPLYRQSEIYARDGVDLDRSTLAGWVGASAASARTPGRSDPHPCALGQLGFMPTIPPCRYSRRATVGRGRDDSGPMYVMAVHVPIQFRLRSGSPSRPDRRGEHPQAHLKSFRGTLQADAYAGFHPLYEGGRIVEAACWAHTRRKFHDIFAATASATASEAIRRIGLLYAVEKQVRGSPPEIRYAVRQARARPVMEELRTWLDQTASEPLCQERYGRSDSLRALSLDRAYTLSRRWHRRDRQQRRRTRVARRRARPQELPLRRLEPRRRTTPLRSTRCSGQPSSTGSTRSTTSDTSSPTSLTIQSTASQSSCPGTSPSLTAQT